jgi:hypothetical protein
MLFGYFTLFVALLIEVVGAYYSITGLAAIFSGAVIPILIMGGSLELGKVTAAVWLKNNWHRASAQFKLYLLPAVVMLMLITSMGIFGYLSKAHNDQTLVSGDVTSKIAIYDEKIKIQRDNIDSARKALQQMDAAVDQTMSRSSDEKGADKATAIRRSQARERGNLQGEIARAQAEIVRLNDQRAPIAAEVRKVEAEVGPIKYIAKLIYDDNPDANILEKAVVWVIITIVAVFDPLALVLILAAQQSIRWAQESPVQERDPATEETAESWFVRAKDRARFWNKKQIEQEKNEIEFESVRIDGGEWIQTGPEIAVSETKKNINDSDNFEPVFDREQDIPDYEQDDGPLTNEQIESIRKIADTELPTGAVITKKTLFPDTAEDDLLKDQDPNKIGWLFSAENPDSSSWVNPEIVDDYAEEESLAQIKELADNQDTQEVFDDDDNHYDDEELSAADKEARRAWKAAHPDETIKKHKLLHQAGHISDFPWNHPDYHPEYQGKPTPPDGDGNLWIPQDGSWVNAGPVDQFNFGDLGLQADNGPTSVAGEMRGFGTAFPAIVSKGDMFLRVDQLPSVLYKYNGVQWIKVDKGLSDQYAYDTAYIDHLIEKIDTGEYDPELLSNAERDSIEQRLKNISNQA